jgi:hypothetical protein
VEDPPRLLTGRLQDLCLLSRDPLPSTASIPFQTTLEVLKVTSSYSRQNA